MNDLLMVQVFAVLDMELCLVYWKNTQTSPRAPGEQKLGDPEELAPLVGYEHQAL